MAEISFAFQASRLNGDVLNGLIIIRSPVMADGPSGWWCEFEIEGFHKPWRAGGVSALDAIVSATEMIKVIISVRYSEWSFTDERGDALVILGTNRPTGS